MPATTARCALPTLWLAAVALVLAGGVAAQEQKPQEPDPFEGMNADGSIPRAPIPAGTNRPERWRYFPEGRLSDENIFDRFLISSFFTPIVFFEEDVGTGGGVVITDLDFRNQRRQEFANIVLTYTTEGQQAYFVNWRRWTHHVDLPDGGVIQDERSFMHVNAGYRKTLTLRYFGRGPDSKPEDESSYSRELTQLSFRHQFTHPLPADDLILSAGAQVEHNKLAGGRVEDVPDTRDAYAGDFADGEDQDMLWLDLRANYDTRDSLHNPYSGFNAGMNVDAAVLQTGGDVGAVFTGFASKVHTLPPLFHDGGRPDEEHPPTDAIAFGFLTQATAGEVPFYHLPTLGGTNTLRGYINNRWTDRAAWHAAAEYRFWFVPRGAALTPRVRVERIGAALFYEVGNVAPHLEDLLDHGPKQSYGASLRISLERTAVFRFDLGFSEEDTNFAIAYGLSF